MFTQVLREIDMLRESGEDECLGENDEDDMGGDYDDDWGAMGGESDEEEEDDDEDDDDGTGIHSKKGAAALLAVPDDGYDEDEDATNAEDPKYIQYLRDQASGSQRFLGGEPVDDEEDESYEFTSPLDKLDVLSHFVGAYASISPAQKQQLNAALTAEDMGRLVEYNKLAKERASAAA
jgi:hypothetical protein